jgi:hypothetical protein
MNSIQNDIREKLARGDRAHPLGALEGDYAENALKMHAFLVTQVKGIAQSKKKPKSTDMAKIASDMAHVWPRLSVARVFAVPEQAYVAVRTWVDRHTTEVVANLPWRGFGQNSTSPQGRLSRAESYVGDVPEDEVQAYLNAIRDAGAVQPLPEHLPFDQTLVVYGAGVPLSDADVLAIAGPEAGEYNGLRLIADLVCADGTVWQFCLAANEEGDIGFFAQGLRNKDGWHSGMNLAPWVIPGIIDLINSFKTVVHETPRTLGFRKRWEKYQKNVINHGRGLLHPIPPPFYKVDLKQELVEERIRERASTMAQKHRTWQLQHRCDVRAHERIRIARGKLPLDPEIEQDLLERKYKLFTHNPVDADTARLMLERHERPKSHDEWLAIKVSWVKSHQRGPEDAPYVPALRVVPGA